jgi:electron transfer flavoprotein alpha subunit
LGKYGASKVIRVENEKLNALDNQSYTKVIAQVAASEGSKVIVLSNNNTGKALAPRLSVRLKAAVGSGLIKLPLSVEPFTVVKKVFSGKAYANMVLKTDIKILTLAQNSFEVIETGGSTVVENFTAEVAK